MAPARGWLSIILRCSRKSSKNSKQVLAGRPASPFTICLLCDAIFLNKKKLVCAMLAFTVQNKISIKISWLISKFLKEVLRFTNTNSYFTITLMNAIKSLINN